MGLPCKPDGELRVAIYSLHHSSIGKATQKDPFTAAAHLRYITRDSAMSHAECSAVPGGIARAGRFLVAYENGLRANGRVADKLMLALPRELSAEERHALVRDFATAVTEGRAPWIAAHHDKGKDAQNPHCHLMIMDRDPSSGRRVFGTSENGSTGRLRVLWEGFANRALERAGRQERIDHRTLEAQGVDRAPTIHVGVKAGVVMRTGRRIASQARDIRNHIHARMATRQVAYPALDNGRSRFEFNLSLRRKAYDRALSADTERDYWQAFDEAAFARDMRELRRIHAIHLSSEDGLDLRGSRESPLERERERGGDLDRGRG